MSESTSESMPRPVRVSVPVWLAKSEGLASRELEGEVLRVTERGVQMRATAVIRESDECLRCGREITNPVSRLAGYGPYCSDELGIPRDFTPDQIEEIRERIKVATTITLWLPKSRITVLHGEIGVVTPVAAKSNGSTAGPYESVPADAPKKSPASLTVSGGKIVARTPFSCKDAVKAIPGARWDREAKAWTYPVSPHAASALVDVLTRSEVEHERDEAFAALLVTAVAGDEARAHKDAAEGELPPVPSATEAWHHQAQAFHFVKPLDAAMLAMDMGTGKSKVAVDLSCARGDHRVLIICPRKVVGVWPREFARHGNCDFRIAAPRKGTVAKRAAEIAAALRDDSPLVVVVNYEASWRESMSATMLGTEWDLVILDESHRIKKPGGKQSMFAAALAKHARRRLCLTGTPMPHSPLDVYGQYRFLDPGIFGTSFVSFRNRYAVMGGYGGHEVLGYQREEELSERMYRIGFRVMAEDVLDLPPITHATLTTQLDGRAAKAYQELHSTMSTEIEEGRVTAANALVKLLRLQQVTSGYLALDDDGGTEEVGTQKRDLLLDFLEDVPTNEPVVVFARFTADLANVRAVCEQTGRRYGEISGNRSDGLRDDSTMATDVDVVGVQIQAGGVGIDLTRARYAVFYSVGFSLGDYEQAVKRVHRPGQERHTSIYHLVCEGTIDEVVYSALQERRDLVDYVLTLWH